MVPGCVHIRARAGTDAAKAIIPAPREIFNDARHLRSSSDRERGPGVLGGKALVPRRGARKESPLAAQVLLPVHVSLPLGEAAHGARAELHHRRRPDPLLPDARTQRAAAHGLGRLRPARRERRDGEPGAAGEVDLRQHRIHEEAAEEPRLRARLDARARHLQARLLQVEPVAVHAPLQERPRLQEDRRGELGPGRPDGARQRAGDRGPRLAHRRAGRLRGRAARRARRPARLARAGEADAEELDRQVRRRAHRFSL